MDKKMVWMDKYEFAALLGAFGLVIISILLSPYETQRSVLLEGVEEENDPNGEPEEVPVPEVNLETPLVVAAAKIERVPSNIAETEISWVTMEVEATAYEPGPVSCGKWADGITATGTNAWTVGVAVDPKVIPLGSLVEIPGYGTVVADDVGGAIKGQKVDVRFKTVREALNWGRKHITIRYRRP